MPATALYRAIMLEVERRRIELGITMLDLDEIAGTQSGYYGKCQAVDAKSGRQARWETVDLFVQALFPAGMRIKIDQCDDGQLSAASYRRKIVFAAAASGKRNVRSLMLDLAKEGGKARAQRLTPYERSEIARKAGQTGGRGRPKRRMDPEGSVIEQPESPDAATCQGSIAHNPSDTDDKSTT